MVQSEITNEVKQHVASNFPRFLETLKALARIPGIAWEAFDAADLEKSAGAVADLLAALDIFDSIEIKRAKNGNQTGAPAVLAKRVAKKSAPTILLYAHHDVQPPGEAAEWLSNPFEPVEREGRLFGRGAADDKAGIVAHLAALETLKIIAGDNFDLGLCVFVEGEEEAGSPTFRNFLEENQSALEADVIIVADSGNWSLDTPALTTTLRGLVSQVIEVKTLDHALHSGMYGGAVPDAMMAMIKLLATLHDEQGNVAVAGLHATTATQLEYSDSDLRRDAGLLANPIGDGTILERIWAKPAITVIGIDGQTVALSSNTMLPSVKAKISLRIAPGQEPDSALQALRNHLEKYLPFGAELKYGDIELGKPFASDNSGWAKSMYQEALSTAWENESVDIGIGGSIPFIADLTEVFPKAQILVTGVEDPDSRAHSPNESVHLASLERAMVAEALFLLAGNAKS